MKKKITLIIFMLIIIGTMSWLSQKNSEGYVFGTIDSEDDTSLWVIELQPTDIEGKTQVEINEILEEKASESRGTFYKVPLINRITKKSFVKGDKVKIYWRGSVIQTAPGKVNKTNFIKKIKD